jgi:hypothetical protein
VHETTSEVADSSGSHTRTFTRKFKFGWSARNVDKHPANTLASTNATLGILDQAKQVQSGEDGGPLIQEEYSDVIARVCRHLLSSAVAHLAPVCCRIQDRPARSRQLHWFLVSVKIEMMYSGSSMSMIHDKYPNC